MSVPAMDNTDATEMPDWRRVVVPLGLGLLLLGGLFRQEVVAAVQTWDASTAYNHCFLIIPIALYLLWDRRFDLKGLRAEPIVRVLVLGLPLGVVWLLAERLGIMEGRQLIAISFAELLLLAILGTRLYWALSGPLLYLYFLVPFGEFLTPKLQDVTAWFIRQGVQVIGIPAYVDGYIIEIPQGTFFVAEACAGLRFLIASVAFGCLYALMMYRSPVRRGAFILVSLVIPIIANGFRALGIVWLGWILGSAEAAAADHVLYGWMFFSIVILILILLGLPFREDDLPTRRPTAPAAPVAFPYRAAIGAVLGLAIIASAGPLAASALNLSTAGNVNVPVAIDLGPGCVARIDPSFNRVRTQRVACGGVAMDVTWTAFSPRITAAPLMAERRRLVLRAETEGLQEEWFQPADGSNSAWRIMRSGDPAFAIAVAMWVDGKPARPGLGMRARMALDSVLGTAFAPMVVTITPAVDWAVLGPYERKLAEESVSSFLKTHPDIDAIVARLSAL
jgi:exosortase A